MANVIKKMLRPAVHYFRQKRIAHMASKASVHYQSVIESIRQSGRTKLNFAAYVIYDSTFGLDSVFKKMMKDTELWNPMIVVIPDIYREREHAEKTYRQTREFFVNKYGKEYVLDGWDPDTDVYYDHLGKFDIVYYANPYDDMVHKYHKIVYASKKNVLPIFVSYGSSSFQAMFCNNIRVVMLPEMNPKNFPGLIHKYKPNYLTATPSHWGAMLKSKVIEDEDLSGFMSVGTGGDGFANAEDRILSFLRQHKCEEVVSDGYGSTEVSAIASSNININYKKGTLGKPLGEVEVKVYDAENDKILGPNEIGEFIITGPTVTLGYYNDPEKTAEVYKKHSDGKTWVHMGDLGRIDEDGFLHYEGRIKNIIARKSFKFSPDSEEKLIESLPNVKECRIVGIPSTEEGQVPSCHITLHDYSNIERDLEIIYDFCTKNFQELHMPCQFKIRKDLPLTKNNKINLNALRLEDIATLVPGVMSCEIRPVNNAQYDYELDINVNYDIASSFDVKNDEDVVKNINQLIRSEKLSNCSIKFNINSVSTKYVDSAIKKVKSKLKAL